MEKKMENEMETRECRPLIVYSPQKRYMFGLYWGNIGIMEKKMETTRMYDSIMEKENGNYSLPGGSVPVLCPRDIQRCLLERLWMRDRW